MASYEQKVREEPRLSVNKFGEYLATNKASRRERILRDAKIPPTYQVMRYDEAKRIIKQTLASGNLSTQEVQSRIAELSLRKCNSEYDERMVKINIEALESFLDSIPLIAFGEYNFSLAPSNAQLMHLGGLSVSVLPDLIVKPKSKNEGPIGSLKLNIGKTFIHTVESAEYVGALIVEHGNQIASGSSDYRSSMVFDVFGKKLIKAPKATTMRMKDAASAAAEIVRQWPSIE